MTVSDKQIAIGIILQSHSVKVSFNVPVNDVVLNSYEILLHEANAALIGELIRKGFSLSLNAKGLSVDKY